MDMLASIIIVYMLQVIIILHGMELIIHGHQAVLDYLLEEQRIYMLLIQLYGLPSIMAHISPVLTKIGIGEMKMLHLK